ncbi:hypothetical protein CBL_20558 [Carabus blaptoides fortunei]
MAVTICSLFADVLAVVDFSMVESVESSVQSDCALETGATPADVNLLFAKTVPQTRAGACYAACVAKGIGLIVDNELNVRYTRQRGLSSRLETIMRLCSYPLTDEDKCAAVKEALTCVKKFWKPA